MKKLFLIAIAALCANAAQAAYLYWQVDSADYQGVIELATHSQVKAVDSSYNEVVLEMDPGPGKKNAINAGYAAINLNQLSDASAYSFYVELYNYNTSSETWDLVGRSTSTFSYSAMVQSNFIDVGDSMLVPQAANIWHGGTYSVPEPTSGMLVMLGLGLLALKRRRA